MPTNPQSNKDKEEKCEVKYGDKKCLNPATITVISVGEIFMICRVCATLAKKQNK